MTTTAVSDAAGTLETVATDFEKGLGQALSPITGILGSLRTKEQACKIILINTLNKIEGTNLLSNPALQLGKSYNYAYNILY